MQSGSDYVDRVPVTAEEEAYRFILHRIRMGTYPSGTRLIPEDIAVEIGTSRMPVREAFRRLSTEGLVTIRPNRGAMVRGLTMQETREVFDMRAVLEGLAATLALDNVDAAELTELERLLEKMEAVNADIPQWVTYHREFHEYLCRLSRSPRLIRQISSLHAVVEPHMRLWLEHADKPMTSREDHMAILDAIRSRDPAVVEATIREHIRTTIPALQELMLNNATAP